MNVHATTTMASWLLSVALFCAAGCSSSAAPVTTAEDAGSSAMDAAGADGLADEDATAIDIEDKGADEAFANALYDPHQLVQVDITLPPADWHLLRHDKRNLDNFLEPGCRSKPFAGTFTYYKAKVTVNGVELADVGVRKKGFIGSITPLKPSLKIKFNKFVKGQLLHGVERLTLNNNKQDPAFLRTCLTYQLFNKAGVPAPRCNFARVRVNGQELGLFSHVESVKKRFLKRSFGDDNGPLYEGTLSDFRPDWTATLEPKTSQTPEMHPDIAKIVAALELPDDKLLPALDELIDRPQFLRFWAMEVLVNHFDGYSGNTNNFYLYRKPDSGRWVFIPWGADATFRDGSFDGPKAPSAVLVRGHLSRRLYEHAEGRKLYLAALQEVLDTVWQEEEIEKNLITLKSLVGELADADPLAKAQDTWFQLYFGNMMSWIKTRRKRIKQVVAEPPLWDLPQPEMLCFTPTVQATGTFKTTFGTLNDDAFKVGSGTLKGTNLGNPFEVMSAGASSGFNKDNPKRVELRLVFQHPTEAMKFVVIALLMNKNDIELGKTLPLPPLIGGQGGFMVVFDAVSKQTAVVGGLWEGTITFEAAGTTDGAAVSGSFDTKWIAFGEAAKK